MGAWLLQLPTALDSYLAVPKNRRPKFELHLKIIDLNNVPLVSGTSYVKWHLPSSSSAEHRGRTEKQAIKEHKVSWDYEKTIPVRLTVDRNSTLQEAEINFEVIQEYSSGARPERIVLGHVKLNLAEYVEGCENEENGVTRRFLMQESKINSTMKMSISMKQIEGDRNFVAPPLKTAPVFGGIAGIMSSEQVEPDDLGHMPSMSSKTREIGELQDMYRRTLAASWAAQVGELPADECIEDIFAGGDGWARDQPGGTGSKRREDDEQAENGAERRTMLGRHKRKSLGFVRHAANKARSQEPKHSDGEDVSVSGRTSIGQQMQSNSEKETLQGYDRMRARQLDEFEAREDLRSWEISTSG